jgi:hypothetical protein
MSAKVCKSLVNRGAGIIQVSIRPALGLGSSGPGKLSGQRPDPLCSSPYWFQRGASRQPCYRTPCRLNCYGNRSKDHSKVVLWVEVAG